jgi:hypothetical protein
MTGGNIEERGRPGGLCHVLRSVRGVVGFVAETDAGITRGRLQQADCAEHLVAKQALQG